MPNRPSSVETDAPGADKDLAFGLIRSVALDGLLEGVLPSCKLEDYGSVDAMLLALSEVPAPACRVDDAPHPGDKASGVDPRERFAAAARVTGPLFGFVGRVGPYEIDEPLDAWLSVAGAMKISSLASSVEMGSPSSLGVWIPIGACIASATLRQIKPRTWFSPTCKSLAIMSLGIASWAGLSAVASGR